jgi:uncharacterized protein involved in exopolysaccharide biosynthesis/uncharacterized protein (DUF1330 family)
VSLEPSAAQLAALRAGDPAERIALVRLFAAKDPAACERWLAALDASAEAAGGRRVYRGRVDRVLLGGELAADELRIDEFPSRELAAESLRSANPHAEAGLSGLFVLAARPRRLPGLVLRVAGLVARLRGGRGGSTGGALPADSGERAVDPEPGALAAFLAAEPERPLVMLNLNLHRDRAAYARYGRNTLGHLLRRGARPLWAAEALGTVVGAEAHPLEEAWSEILLVYYPTRRAMLDMLTDPGYQAGLPDRLAGLARAALVATCPARDFDPAGARRATPSGGFGPLPGWARPPRGGRRRRGGLMTRALGPPLAGGELQPRVAPAIPVHFAPLGGGDWEQDEAARARRRRLRWRSAGGGAVALLLLAGAVALASRIYEARSALLIRPPNGSTPLPQAVDGALQAELEILQSSAVVQSAIERVGIWALYPGLADEPADAALAAATDRVKSALAVRTMPGSDVIEVTFRHGEAELAAATVNRLVEHFQESRRETLAPAQNERFLQEGIEEQGLALAAAEAKLALFESENPALAASDPRDALGQRRAAIEAELGRLRAAYDEARAAGNAEDPSVARARARLDELELEEQNTLRTHTEGSRAVAKIRHEIQLVRDYVASKEKSATREQGRRFEVLRSRQRELETQLAALGEGERDLPELERRWRELVRERDGIVRRLDAYQRELEAATLAADVGEHKVAFSVRVLEPARAPSVPTVPRARARLAWGLFGCALLALLGAALIDWLERRRVRRPPAVWTAHVGAGGQAGSVALLMPHPGKGSSGSPVVLLLSGAGPAEPPSDSGAQDGEDRGA